MKIPVNNTYLGYDDHGIGLPILFLPAFPLNRTMWQGELVALLREERYRLIALDWRGFGESEITDPISTMDLFADDVAGLLDSLGIQQAVLCGLSMGGYASFAFMRKYPERVCGLILADTRPGAHAQKPKPTAKTLRALPRLKVLEQSWISRCHACCLNIHACIIPK